jgi:membrane protease YdiL (CAAX protease family)
MLFGVAFLVTLRLAAPYLLPVAPPSVPAQLSSLPLPSAICALVAVALSSAVVEETAFRGYVQRPLEERFGLVPAIAVAGVLFWASHLPKVTVTHLPGHLVASVVFGLLAFLTRSLRPAMVAHALADLVLQPAYFLRAPAFVWTSLAARPLWQGASTPEEQRIFAGLAVVLVATGAATALSLRTLARWR